MSKFSALKEKLSHRKGVRSPGGLAKFIGDRKYGKAGMAEKSAKGRRHNAMKQIARYRASGSK